MGKSGAETLSALGLMNHWWIRFSGAVLARHGEERSINMVVAAL
jgi:hypothetical protein